MLALASLLSVSPLGFSAVPACKTIAELLAETESLSTLNAAVKAVPDVLAALEDPTQTLTVFAPNDDAFSPFAPELVEIIEGIADGSTLMGDDGVACEIGGWGPDDWGYYYSASYMSNIRSSCPASCDYCSETNTNCVDSPGWMDVWNMTCADWAMDYSFSGNADCSVADAITDPADCDGSAQNEELLSDLLSAHAISGVYKAEDVLALIPGFGEENVINVTTVNGETIYLGSQAFAPNSVFVGPVLGGDVGPDPAEVVVPNIEACNGIVHVIDNVLGGDDEDSCLPVNHLYDEPGEITCDCVEPDNPCLADGQCVPEPSCGESCLSTCWTIEGYCLDHEGHSEEECLESMSMMTFPFAQFASADHFDCDVACTGETHSDDEGRRRLRAKKEGKFGIKRRLQVGKKGGKAAISFTDKHGI